ncbi:MarR family winged helix-turn-helix transcriptional regulator [Dactylosporangium sp. CA-092794]|uniref:MarR family winged helix-turn-helix transcriptional regulator n=1 Tax=Dactylosporangium sp. CA-092794 TaxID=3239929 RepID=UPI003D8D32A4
MRQIITAQMRAGEKWIRERDISLEQGFILGYLRDNPGSIQRDIAREVRRGEANVSSMLQKLEKRHLVERRLDAGNDRIKRVYATPAGVALIDGLDLAMAAVDEDILAPITRSEREALTLVLDRIAARLPNYPRW